MKGFDDDFTVDAEHDYYDAILVLCPVFLRHPRFASCAFSTIPIITLINPWRACAARVTVTTFSATTRNKAAKKRYQRVQCHTGLILKRAIFVKVLRSKVMA